STSRYSSSMPIVKEGSLIVLSALEAFDAVEVRTRENRGERGGKGVRPLRRPGRRVDEVLADLHRGVRQPGRLGVGADRIAGGLARRIRLVVADDAARVGGGKLGDERDRHARVLVPQHADMPGPDETVH